MDLKRCSLCHGYFPPTLDYFCSHSKTKDGFNCQCRVCVATQSKERRRKDPRGQMIYASRHRAKRDCVPHEIDKEDIKIPEVCPVLGIPLFLGDGGPCPNSPTIDKIIPSQGYVKGNIVVVSHRANALKSDATLEELKLLFDFYGEPRLCTP